MCEVVSCDEFSNNRNRMKTLDAGPTASSLALRAFVAGLYIFMLCLGSLLVQYSSLESNSYKYDPAVVVFLVEIAKAIFSASMVFLEYHRTGYEMMVMTVVMV